MDNILNVKETINNIKVKALTLRIEIIRLGLMCYSKPWLLEDSVFSERYSKLINMENDTVYDINELEIFLLNQNNESFLVTDLIDELYYIVENIKFEYSYYKCTKDLLALLDNYNSIQSDIITIFLENNELLTSSYDSQVKMNRAVIKKLRKERKDNIE